MQLATAAGAGMAGHLLLHSLLLSLPLIAGWTASNCLVTEGSWLPLVSRFFLNCPLNSRLPLLAVCTKVTNLTQALEAVPQSVEGLCLAGSISVLPQDALSNYPGLKVLGLNLRLTRLLPGALRGLGQLQELSFMAPQSKNYLFLHPNALDDLRSLQKLNFLGPCLDRNSSIQLPTSLRQLVVRYSCLQDVGELDDIFPDLAHSPFSGDARTLDVLDLSFNWQLKMASPGALQGLRLGTLHLDHTKMDAAAVLSLGLQKLKSLSVLFTVTAELPAETVAHFELQELQVGNKQIGHITLEALAFCHSLQSLVLQNGGLTALPPNFLAAMPRLQRLNLAGNQLQRVRLCTNETGFVSGLWTLNLSDNGLLALSPATFSCLSHLRELLLQRNQLTLTLDGWGLHLETQNISEIFPALRQLTLLGSSLEALCSQDTSNFFLWQLPGLQSLKVRGDGHSPRPCCITGLPNLQELKLDALKYRARPRPVQLQELVGELPRLRVLQLARTGLETLSAAAFQGLGSLQVLVLDWEKGLVLDGGLQERSPQMPQYVYILTSSLACRCANAWLEPWFEGSPRTYMWVQPPQLCPAESGGGSKHPLFPFLLNHCQEALELKLFGGSFAFLLLLISLPLLQEARNSWVLYLQALLRAWFQGLRGQKNEGKNFLYDVFVSHCRQDQGWVVQELLPALEGCPPEGQGLRLCLPERDFEPGKDVVDNVADSMASSPITLCVLSHRALRTPRCRLELRLATSLLLAAPHPPVLLLIFLEPVSRHQLPRYHRLARLLRRGDYCVWPKEDEGKDSFWAWLRGRLGQPRCR
ncbi:toll-like receptor 12 isoform X2 [Marmota marmota marmota]|uniref:toll-like receptor 12 isoform X2 n=1 Tax=Marmota marmota marmota TaxID=9994 RepID=UPI00076288B9|nr:toll-like receptor 12 isoform X2 [Marmota marmota marmota]